MGVCGLALLWIAEAGVPPRGARSPSTEASQFRGSLGDGALRVARARIVTPLRPIYGSAKGHPRLRFPDVAALWGMNRLVGARVG
jgi:hypothetical protein